VKISDQEFKNLDQHEFFYSVNFFRFMGSPGLNFNAINLKILQIVGILVAYNMYEFRMNNSKI